MGEIVVLSDSLNHRVKYRHKSGEKASMLNQATCLAENNDECHQYNDTYDNSQNDPE